MGTTAAVPFTAWEQAVFVVLFVVLVLGLLAWFERQTRNWNAFTRERDAAWQQWMDKANNGTAKALESVTEALKELGTKLDAHDDRVEDRFSRAEEKIRQQTAPGEKPKAPRAKG